MKKQLLTLIVVIMTSFAPNVFSVTEGKVTGVSVLEHLVGLANAGSALNMSLKNYKLLAQPANQDICLQHHQLTRSNSTTGLQCCWKLVNGVWMCRPEFC